MEYYVVHTAPRGRERIAVEEEETSNDRCRLDYYGAALRRDGEEEEEGRAYEMVSFLVVVFLTALKAGRGVTVFSAKFWNLDHQIGAACSNNKWGRISL